MFTRFADPGYILLCLLLPATVWIYLRRRRRGSGALRFSSLGVIHTVTPSRRIQPRDLLFALRMGVLSLLILAIARPQSGIHGEEVITEGVDIMLCLDISSSMLAEDIRPNRVEAAKAVAAQFVSGRKHDRIGLVAFSGEAFTQCPLTLDYGILFRFLETLRVGMIEDGTAIGMGLITAVKRLKNSEAKSKVIILITDGQNNRGEIDPLTAAHVAQAFGIKVYTIGAGTRGTALYPVQDPIFGKRYVPMPVDVDEASLRQIADLTGGRYFRATDRESLEAIYREIDSLEKTEIQVKEYTRYTERFPLFLGVALGLLLVEVLLTHTRFRKIP